MFRSNTKYFCMRINRFVRRHQNKYTFWKKLFLLWIQKFAEKKYLLFIRFVSLYMNGDIIQAWKWKEHHHSVLHEYNKNRKYGTILFKFNLNLLIYYKTILLKELFKSVSKFKISTTTKHFSCFLPTCFTVLSSENEI